MRFRLTLVCLVIFVFQASYAMDENTQSYYKAYNACSPQAQKQTMQQCGYAKLVEGYYISCMGQKGFGDADETMDKNRYSAYLESYRQCSVIANGAAQKACNYGVFYQKFYNQCMVAYGFDANGEPITRTKEKATHTDTNPATKNNDIIDRNPLGKALDGLF